MAIEKSLYYNLDNIQARNATYNFIVGGRGIGKTYSLKRYVINSFIKTGAQFILLRRYKGELSTRSTFYADLIGEFDGYGMRIKGDEFQITRNPADTKPTWETMGFAVALSISSQKKSVAYPKVETIMYDEFIIERGVVQYLKNEHIVMNDFYSTVDRYKGKTKVFFLANSIGIMNPYFIEYGIEPDREWVRMRNGFICAHFPDDEDFKSAVRETAFGKFIAGSEYETYAVNNEFKDNGTNLLGRKTESSTYYATIDTGVTILSMWRDPETFIWYGQEKRPRVENLYTVDPGKVSDEMSLLEYGDRLLSIWRTAFKRGKVQFDKPRSRSSFTQIFKRG